MTEQGGRVHEIEDERDHLASPCLGEGSREGGTDITEAWYEVVRVHDDLRSKLGAWRGRKGASQKLDLSSRLMVRERRKKSGLHPGEERF